MLTPYVGTTYKLAFTNPFNVADGIYTVMKIMTYDEAIGDNVVLNQIYIDAGKTDADYQNDIPTLRTDKILKIKSVSDDKLRYVPMSFLKYEPNANVKEYMRLVIGVDLGVFDNMNDVVYLKNTIQNLIDGGMGINNEPLIAAVNTTIWMTEEEYNQTVVSRESRKNTLINLYTENARLRKELDAANVKVAGYENTLIALSKSSTSG